MTDSIICAWNYDCDSCKNCRKTYEEYDTGYAEYSCELMERLHDCDEYPIEYNCHEYCPLNFNYKLKEGKV